MKNTRFAYSLLTLLALTFLFAACGEKKKEIDKQQYWNIVSIRTLGLAFLEENKLEEAKQEFEKLIKEAPDEASGYANLGLVYLRMGKYDEALEPLLTAVEKQPEDPAIMLILAKTYEQKGDSEKAIEILEEIVDIDDQNIKALYNLSELYGSASSDGADQKKLAYLRDIIDIDAGNIVIRLQYIDQLIDSNQLDAALAQMEDIKQTFPEFSQEANAQYQLATQNLRNGEAAEAAVNVMKFHNLLKLSSLYQSGVKDLKGPGGALIGFPVITVSESPAGEFRDNSSILELIKFANASESAKLNTLDLNGAKLSLGDYDADGDIDILLGSTLLNNDLGSFSDKSNESGLQNLPIAEQSIFVDLNNDGFMDIVLGSGDQVRIMQNNQGTSFTDVSERSGIKTERPVSSIVTFDADHDGDLDLFLGTSGTDYMYRNNSDGSFTEVGEAMGVRGLAALTTSTGIGDIDEDGDLDFIVSGPEGITVFSNQRQGRFENTSEKAGVIDLRGTVNMDVADYNNDGFPDILTQTADQRFLLLKNDGDGVFNVDEKAVEYLNQTLNGLSNKLRFLDFDNDGFLDILSLGKNVKLVHNDGDGIFSDQSQLIIDQVSAVVDGEVADFNQDGDLDLFLSKGQGSIQILRNDGGNTNHYLKMKLVGLRTGSGKNNHFGIGAKIEVRAQDLYQMYTVTQPEILIGIGHRKSADVVRIQWTNGVPQNIFTPSADKSMVESQVLKGSCPFLYAWDGEKFTFVKDMMWKSALGMPLGIMGGNTAYAFADASKEYMLIPGEALKVKDGKYTLQITEELWETVYFDKAELMVVDHPASFDIYIDEKMSAPPYPELEIYEVEKPLHAKSVKSGDGTDLTRLVSKKDDEYVTNFIPSEYQGITNTRELILDLGKVDSQKPLHLFLQGWIFPTDASINVATGQSSTTAIVPLHVQVLNSQGQWQTVIENLGFPLGKEKTIIADLSGKFTGSSLQVKLITNMELYWDHIFYTQESPSGELRINSLQASEADLHYRGFSKMYRKGGRYGPHWFDYQTVTTGQKWRDLIGDYTRYGDVRELVLDGDDKYIIANAGDEITINYDASELPDLPTGWKRDFIIYSEGWVKDGDLNTAHSKTVEPLPFHGIGSYPYGPGDKYPDDDEHNEYRSKYNTRSVKPEAFNKAIRKWGAED